MSTKSSKIILVTLFVLNFFTFLSCKKNPRNTDNRIVIWTDNSEFAQYIELFNKTSTENKAILVYKENPALSLPPAKDELQPDLIIGSWLRTDSPQKTFKSLDYLFDTKSLTSEIFYPQLLDAGKKRKVQYLLPVSFNLPSVIFSIENKELVTESYTLSPEQIRQIATNYNAKDKNENYTKIGFTPLSNNDFLYLTAKLYGADFHEEKNEITWNIAALTKTTTFLKEWIQTENTSAQIEQDFAFKYLFMPPYRQATSNRTLFAYTTSDELFTTMKDTKSDIDYRWISRDKILPIEDTFTMMGIHKKANNVVGATLFIKWFFQSENQRSILERKQKLNLETQKFGIVGGFSSVRDVTEHILPVFYTQLLTNLPPSQMFTVPNKLPARWESYKSQVVEPYIHQAITATSETPVATMESLEKEWRKKTFE